MGERSDQIERQIEIKRSELSENFNELGEKVRTAINWRAQFQDRPGAMLALAFGGGFFLSALFPSVRSARRNYGSAQPPASSSSAGEHGSFGIRSDGRASKRPSVARENLEAMSDALMSVALCKATTFIDELVPGFREEFARAKSERRPEQSYSTSSNESHWPKSSLAEAG
jgi:hypothetical protein